MDLEELIKQSKAGDHQAYRLVVREYAPSIRAFLASRLNDFHAVEDLSQVVFVSAFKALASYKHRADFRSWLLSISRNKLMDHFRKQYSQSNLKSAYEMEIQTSLSTCDGAFAEINEAKINKLKSCLQKLPEEAKSLMMARYFNSETVTSLAERLSSTENAISSKLFRLKKKLKTCIESS